MPLGYVYKIVNPAGAIYIGSTKSFNKRISFYKRLDCIKQTKVYESLIKYGYESHVIEIICTAPYNELEKKERELGIFYNALDAEMGLNCILPGSGDMKCLQSEEYKERFRKKCELQIANQLSGLTKEKMSKNSKRHKPSEETKLKSKTKLSRPIIQFDKNGNYINEFESTIDASVYTGIGRSSIKENLNNRSNSAGGFIWKFKDGIKKGVNHKKVIQMDMKGNITKIHDSLSHAARSINVDFTSIRFVAKGLGHTAGGFKWKYFSQERSETCRLAGL